MFSFIHSVAIFNSRTTLFPLTGHVQLSCNHKMTLYAYCNILTVEAVQCYQEETRNLFICLSQITVYMVQWRKGIVNLDREMYLKLTSVYNTMTLLITEVHLCGKQTRKAFKCNERDDWNWIRCFVCLNDIHMILGPYM